MDARSVHRDGLHQCAPGRLGRVRHGLASAEYVAAHVGDTAVFIAQALPWSASSHGAVSGQAVWVDAKDEKDLEKYKGKLAGKIVFFGEMREVRPVDKPLFERRDDANLKS